MKKTYFNSDEDICWPPQCHNFGSTAGAAAPAVNMLEEALLGGGGGAEVESAQDNIKILTNSEFSSDLTPFLAIIGGGGGTHPNRTHHKCACLRPYQFCFKGTNPP